MTIVPIFQVGKIEAQHLNFSQSMEGQEFKHLCVFPGPILSPLFPRPQKAEPASMSWALVWFGVSSGRPWGPEQAAHALSVHQPSSCHRAFAPGCRLCSQHASPGHSMRRGAHVRWETGDLITEGLLGHRKDTGFFSEGKGGPCSALCTGVTWPEADFKGSWLLCWKKDWRGGIGTVEGRRLFRESVQSSMGKNMVTQTTATAGEWWEVAGFWSSICMCYVFKFLLWKISNAYKSRETSLMNSHAPSRYAVNLSCVSVCQALSTAAAIVSLWPALPHQHPPPHSPQGQIGGKQCEVNPVFPGKVVSFYYSAASPRPSVQLWTRGPCLVVAS